MDIVKKASESTIKEAARIICNGGTVVTPTDTNYNVVTSPFSERGVNRIFEMKGRDSMSPLTLFMGDSMDMEQYAYLTPIAVMLAKRLWPEKFSIILFQKPILPLYVTCGFGTVALTLHSNPVLRKIAHLVNTPLAGTSANLSGTGNVPIVEKAIDHIGGHVDLIIDGGTSPVDGANTIIDLTFDRPVLARKGAYPVEKLIELIDLDCEFSEKYRIEVRKRFSAAAEGSRNNADKIE